MMKPKENKGYNIGMYDECQTPPYALDPLIYFLDEDIPIWECASGKGTLVRGLEQNGFCVFQSDIIHGNEDFFTGYEHGTIVTNPPYSIKYDWLEQCYLTGNPFALLMPVEMLGTAKGQRLFERYGIEIIFMSPRVDFYMPHKGWKGGGAQFPTAWFTWKLNLPKENNFATLNKPKRSELEEYWKRALGE